MRVGEESPEMSLEMSQQRKLATGARGSDTGREDSTDSPSSSNAVVANTDGSMSDPIARIDICERPSSSKEDVGATSSVVRFLAGHRVILNHRS